MLGFFVLSWPFSGFKDNSKHVCRYGRKFTQVHKCMQIHVSSYRREISVALWANSNQPATIEAAFHSTCLIECGIHLYRLNVVVLVQPVTNGKCMSGHIMYITCTIIYTNTCTDETCKCTVYTVFCTIHVHTYMWTK